MIARLIRICIDNRAMVLLLAASLIGASLWAMRTLRVDAIPDLSDVQVIIRTDYPGQAPQIVEDQVTYPLSTAMLSVPFAKTVRGSSMFGGSFVFIIFEDGTDLYWARSRVLEQLASIGSRLPANVTPQIGPDATGVGWVYQYALTTGQYSPAYPQGLWQNPRDQAWYATPQNAPKDAQPHLLKHRTLPAAMTHCPITGQSLVQSDQTLADLRSLQDWLLRYELTAVDGVSEVASVGGYELQYQVVADPVKLLALNLSMADLQTAIADANMDAGGGIIEAGEVELMVRSKGYLGSAGDASIASTQADKHAQRERVLDDLRHVSLGSTAEGSPIYLSSVATVELGPAARRGVLEWQGQGEAAGGIVVMRFGENARTTIDAVKAKLAQLQNSLPAGVEIQTGYDRSDLIDRAVGTLTHTLLEEIIVVALVCILFLLHARSELVAVIVVPAGILASLLTMRLVGINANIMSLGGLAIAIGVMVDSSIIMVENAHKHLDRLRDVPEDERPPLSQTIYEAAAEVGPSLFFSLLIITVSFIPVFALDQQSGRLFKPLAFTKTFAMGWAAVLAVTLIPVLMTILIRPRVLPTSWSKWRTLIVTLGLMIIPAMVLWILPLDLLEPWRLWIVLGWLVLSGMVLVPQRLIHEDRNPLSWLMQKIYHPFFILAIRWRWVVIAMSLLMIASTWYPLSRMGSEFMPPLEEGDVLYMPTTDPGLSLTKAKVLLQQTDKLIASFPEVQNVTGKAGWAETATDPAPISMFETVVMLKRDKTQWRHLPVDRFFDDWPSWIARPLSKVWSTSRPITLDELIYGYHLPAANQSNPNEGQYDNKPQTIAVPGMNQVLQIPGLTNSWTMPIRTRIDMLATGIKTPVGIKIMGPSLSTIDEIAQQITGLLQSDPLTAGHTLSAFADKNTGGYYLDIHINRQAIARYNLSIAQVQQVIATAVGGQVITTTVQGVERYPVNLRYPREMRDDPEALRNILVKVPQAKRPAGMAENDNAPGMMIPLGQLASINIVQGPSMIKSENARPSGWIYIDLAGQDVGTYVANAKQLVESQVNLPVGYSVVWTGQYQYMQEAKERLMLIIPITGVVILLLLYLATGSWARVAIVSLALPFSLVGAFWFVWLLDYNLSLAVWVGVIALAGLDAETSLVMLLYLDSSYDHFKKKGMMRNAADLWHAVHDGAVMRIRPKTMTVATTFIGLLPLMWASGAGADTMRRLAAPMIGGLVTSFLLELLIYPAIFYIVKSWSLPRVYPSNGNLVEEKQD